VTDATSVATGEHQLAVTVDGGNISLYVDGQFKGSTILNNVYGGNVLANLSNSLAYIGASVYGTQSSFNGLIDEFRIYNTALAPNDIANLNSAGNLPNANTASTAVTSRPIAIAAQGGILDLNGNNMTVSGNITAVATSVAGATGTLTISSPTSNRVVFTGNQTTAAATGAQQNFTNLNIGTGITLQVGTGGTAGNLSGGTVTLATATSALEINKTGSSTFGSGISGVGSVSHTNTGTTTLNGNAYTATGPVSVAKGTLAFGVTTNARQAPGIMLKMKSLTLASNTVLDMSNHDLMIGNSNLLTVENLILAGFGLGNPGDPAISSSTALTLGTTFPVPLDADALLGSGAPGSAIGQTWDNVAISEPGTQIVKYTYVGDITLDGQVDGLDFATAASNFGVATPGLANIQNAWLAGDVTFDGVVDGLDFATMASNFGSGVGSPLGQLSAPSLGGGSSAVPEPATLFLLGLGSAGMLLRRKKRSV